jgi:hypothetical protein
MDAQRDGQHQVHGVELPITPCGPTRTRGDEIEPHPTDYSNQALIVGRRRPIPLNELRRGVHPAAGMAMTP